MSTSKTLEILEFDSLKHLQDEIKRNDWVTENTIA